MSKKISKELRKNKIFVNHGMSGTRAYRIHQRMIRAKCPVTARWKGELDGFLNFVSDMGHPPKGQGLILRKGATTHGPGHSEWGAVVDKTRPMPIEFIVDNVDIRKAGIYKLLFQNGYFYIGSTGHLGKRISCFKTEIRDGYAHNKMMKRAIFESKHATFSVIEYVDTGELALQIEDIYIKKNADNPMMLNRSPTAFSNKGCKWSKEERLKMSLANKGKPKSPDRKKRGQNNKTSP